MELLKRWFVEDKGTVNVSTTHCLSSCEVLFCGLPADISVAPGPGGGVLAGVAGQLTILCHQTKC